MSWKSTAVWMYNKINKVSRKHGGMGHVGVVTVPHGFLPQDGLVPSPATNTMIQEGWDSCVGFERHFPIKNMFSRMSVLTTSSLGSWLDPHGTETLYSFLVLGGAMTVRGKPGSSHHAPLPSSTQPPGAGAPCAYDKFKPKLEKNRRDKRCFHVMSIAKGRT